MIQSGFGTGKSWYRKKSRNRYRKKIGTGKKSRKNLVPEPVSEKFGAGKSLGTETLIFFGQKLGIYKIYDG